MSVRGGIRFAVDMVKVAGGLVTIFALAWSETLWLAARGELPPIEHEAHGLRGYEQL